MTTPADRSHCIARLRACTSLSALKARWDGFGKEYQHDTEVQAVNEQMEAKLK